jgi:hypothetical protein
MTGPVRRWLPIVATAAFAFAAGVAVGGLRVSAPVAPAGADTSAVSESAGVEPATRSPSRDASDRDEAGAVRAAVLLTTTFDGVGLLDDRQREELLASHAASDHKDELSRALSDVARLIRHELDVEVTDLDSPEFVWRSVPAGVRTESYTATRSVIAVWGTGVVIARGLPLVQPGWRTTRVEMAWEDDAWRLVAFRSEMGPEPPTVGGTPDAGLQARLINGFDPLPLTAAPSQDVG